MNMIDEIEFWEQQEQLERYLKGKSIAMIGLSDSIGCTNGDNYLYGINRTLKLQPSEFMLLNAHSRLLEREHHIEELIAGNASVKDIKKIQNQENNERIKKLLEEAHFPQDEKIANILKQLLRIKSVKVEKKDENTCLRDVIREYDDVNIFYSTNTNTIDTLTPAWYIEKELEQRKRNYDYILSINPSAQIYAISFPTEKKEEEKNDKYNHIAEDLNASYERLAIASGTAFVNISKFKKVLRRENGKYVLTPLGTDILAFLCVQSMYHTKIKSKKAPKYAILKPYIHENENAIEYLLKKSIERKKELEILKTNNNALTRIFLTKNQIFEEEQQKVYKKVLEEK